MATSFATQDFPPTLLQQMSGTGHELACIDDFKPWHEVAMESAQPWRDIPWWGTARSGHTQRAQELDFANHFIERMNDADVGAFETIMAPPGVFRRYPPYQEIGASLQHQENQLSTFPEEDDEESEYETPSELNVTECTMMLCNIPCQLVNADVVAAIDEAGFAGVYDFVHLPQRRDRRHCNRGYAFVNFKSPEDAARFSDTFQSYHFEGTESDKICVVRSAHKQGFDCKMGNKKNGSKARARARKRERKLQVALADVPVCLGNLKL